MIYINTPKNLNIRPKYGITVDMKKVTYTFSITVSDETPDEQAVNRLFEIMNQDESDDTNIKIETIPDSDP